MEMLTDDVAGGGCSFIESSSCRSTSDEVMEEVSDDMEDGGDSEHAEYECVETEFDDGCSLLDGGALPAVDPGECVRIENRVVIRSLHDIYSLELSTLHPNECKKLYFVSLEIGYMFYYWYARVKGFGPRKSKKLKNKFGEVLQQTFVCYREGKREDRGLTLDNRKRYVKPETRCECKANIRVHIEINLNLWYVSHFDDTHNHPLMPDEHCRMLASHRTMTDVDVMQLNNMRAVGIGTPQIYGTAAYQTGGYDRVGYRIKDVYNQVGRQRKLKNDDAKCALQFLKGLGVNDRMMFYRYTVDEDNRLQHLFWCDGMMQVDYSVFGDVLAFDATYRKNKYECPLVIFSGVNHHNNTVVVGVAVVANETEETYVWVLEQFLEAMKGKSPMSVITDGDVAIKNAIRRVFPNAHHRLCAWHLLRNASSHIPNPQFKKDLRKCMLGDYEVGEFKRRWDEMIAKFGVEDHPWVLEMYEKRFSWCTAYIRGRFFAGFRTTSRCEALHSQLKKFVFSTYNLTELLHHFHRWLSFMRHREVEANFDSMHRDAFLRTQYKNLERCASKLFTRKVFDLFRPILERSGTVNVVGCKESFDYLIYSVTKYEVSNRVWHVSFQPSTNVVKCSCRKMESVGLPCEHILRLLVHLNISKLPSCLILKRWTINAKEDVFRCQTSNNLWGCDKDVRYMSLMEYFKDISVLAAENFEDYEDLRNKAIGEKKLMMAKNVVESEAIQLRGESDPVNICDPPIVRTKGCGSRRNARTGRVVQHQIIKKCSKCKQPGHNIRSCPTIINNGSALPMSLENCYPNENEFEGDSMTMYSCENDEVGVHDDNESVVGYDCHSFQASTYNTYDK